MVESPLQKFITACSMLRVSWGKPGIIELMLNPLLSGWYEVCSDTRGKALPWGRFRVDPAPAQTLRQLRRFLTRCPN
jgi:hypothetical protein